MEAREYFSKKIPSYSFLHFLNMGAQIEIILSQQINWTKINLLNFGPD